MWGRQTLLSCLKTNDLLTWLSPDDTFPPPHQHQYLGRLNYQNGPLLSLLGYKVKKTGFGQEKNCSVADILQLPPWSNFPCTRFVVNQCSYLNFFPLTRCAFICILLLIFSLSSHLLHTGRSRSDKSWRGSVCLLRLQISDRSAVTLLLCFFAMKWYCDLVCIYLFETRFGLQGILELILLKMAFLFWSRSSWGESWLIVIKFGQLIDH